MTKQSLVKRIALAVLMITAIGADVLIIKDCYHKYRLNNAVDRRQEFSPCLSVHYAISLMIDRYGPKEAERLLNEWSSAPEPIFSLDTNNDGKSDRLYIKTSPGAEDSTQIDIIAAPSMTQYYYLVARLHSMSIEGQNRIKEMRDETRTNCWTQIRYDTSGGETLYMASFCEFNTGNPEEYYFFSADEN